jgi:hypothetical protein
MDTRPMTGLRLKTGLTATLFLSLAGAALAAEAAPGPVPALRYVAKAGEATTPLLDLSGPAGSLALPYGQDRTSGMSQFPRTAVDHSFATDKLTGSVGYLCGLHAGPDAISGPAASSDPVGTFLGAKLSYAF